MTCHGSNGTPTTRALKSGYTGQRRKFVDADGPVHSARCQPLLIAAYNQRHRPSLSGYTPPWEFAPRVAAQTEERNLPLLRSRNDLSVIARKYYAPVMLVSRYHGR